MKILIHFNTFSNVVGGSEYLPLLLIKEFQSRGHSVVLTVTSQSDVELACKNYDIAIDYSKFEMVDLSPQKSRARLFNRLFRCYREWKLQQVAKRVDLCISTVNPVDFGRPGFHFVYMLGFTPKTRAWVNDLPYFKPKTPLIKELWRKISWWFAGTFLLSLRTPGEICQDAKECVYPNSNWVKQKIEDYYHCRICSCYYPPTVYQPYEGVIKRSDTVVFIGRINPQKKILEIISTVENVRHDTGVDLQLKIAGHLGNDAYASQLRECAKRRAWVHLLGVVKGVEKQRLLASSKFALHFLGKEAFGISIVEYLKSGVVPVVPNCGGAAEVVSITGLCAKDTFEAVQILNRLVQDRHFYDNMQSACLERAKNFSFERYMNSQKNIVEEILEEGIEIATPDC